MIFEGFRISLLARSRPCGSQQTSQQHRLRSSARWWSCSRQHPTRPSWRAARWSWEQKLSPYCSSPSVSNLRAVIGSGMFSRRQVNPGISFSRLAAQPYLRIMELDFKFFSSKLKSQKHQFLISYQLDRRTSPEPLPGTITALLTGLIIKQKLYSLNCATLYY